MIESSQFKVTSIQDLVKHESSSGASALKKDPGSEFRNEIERFQRHSRQTNHSNTESTFKPRGRRDEHHRKQPTSRKDSPRPKRNESGRDLESSHSASGTEHNPESGQKRRKKSGNSAKQPEKEPVSLAQKRHHSNKSDENAKASELKKKLKKALSGKGDRNPRKVLSEIKDILGGKEARRALKQLMQKLDIDLKGLDSLGGETDGTALTEKLLEKLQKQLDAVSDKNAKIEAPADIAKRLEKLLAQKGDDTSRSDLALTLREAGFSADRSERLADKLFKQLQESGASNLDAQKLAKLLEGESDKSKMARQLANALGSNSSKDVDAAAKILERKAISSKNPEAVSRKIQGQLSEAELNKIKVSPDNIDLDKKIQNSPKHLEKSLHTGTRNFGEVVQKATKNLAEVLRGVLKKGADAKSSQTASTKKGTPDPNAERLVSKQKNTNQFSKNSNQPSKEAKIRRRNQQAQQQIQRQQKANKNKQVKRDLLQQVKRNVTEKLAQSGNQSTGKQSLKSGKNSLLQNSQLNNPNFGKSNGRSFRRMNFRFAEQTSQSAKSGKFDRASDAKFKRRLKMALTEKGGNASFKMQTDAGDKMRVKINVTSGRADVVFQSDNASMAKRLDRTLNQLKQSLERAGFSDGDVDIQTEVQDQNDEAATRDELQDKRDAMADSGYGDSQEAGAGTEASDDIDAQAGGQMHAIQGHVYVVA